MKYPEHEKLNKRADEHQTVSEFLEFLESKGVEFRKPDELIAEFLNVDITKLKKEKEEMYQQYRQEKS